MFEFVKDFWIREKLWSMGFFQPLKLKTKRT